MADTVIDLLRHGQIDGPSAMYGRTDVPLSALGWQQLQQATLSLYAGRLLTSPLRRCADFARHLANERRLPLTVEDDLREYDFGDWDGIPFRDLFGDPAINPHGWEALEAFGRSPAAFTPPNAESLAMMEYRVSQCWQRLLDELRGQHSLIVCHAGTIRLILAQLLPVDWTDGRWFSALEIGYASVTRIRVSDHPQAVPRIEWLARPTEVH